MAEHEPELIFIKRRSNHEDAHHGGAWKIAFADFMTAMMAFFLVLWIINATDKDTKTVIARYFNPVKVENPALATKGVHGVDAKTTNISDETAAKDPNGPTVDPKHPSAKDDLAGGARSGNGTSPKSESKSKPANAKETAEPAAQPPSMPETELFSDPYRSLDKIDGGRSIPSPAAQDLDVGSADPTREAGASTIEAFRDPFKPIGPGAVDDHVSLDASESPAAVPDMEPQTLPGKSDKPVAKPPATPETAPAAPAASPPDASHPPRLATAAAQLLKELQEKLGALGKSSAGPALDVQATDEGLLISLTDRLNFSMFAIGSAEPTPAVVHAMNAIAKVLESRPGAIVLRGHTDGRAYRSATYDNWRLSSARAQMSYYMLTRAGVPEGRFSRVEGFADRELKDPAHPLSAENRRIEILLRPAKP